MPVFRLRTKVNESPKPLESLFETTATGLEGWDMTFTPPAEDVFILVCPPVPSTQRGCPQSFTVGRCPVMSGRERDELLEPIVLTSAFQSNEITLKWKSLKDDFAAGARRSRRRCWCSMANLTMASAKTWCAAYIPHSIRMRSSRESTIAGTTRCRRRQSTWQPGWRRLSAQQRG
jgi:hypothetical protein